MAIILVLGGARSGKSAYAQGLAEDRARHSGRPLAMIATAEALDSEMEERIARHRAERGAAWRTIEAPIGLAAAIDGLRPGEIAVVDCLTLWLSNLLMRDLSVEASAAELIAAIGRSKADLILVSNEVGQGIVPDNALARRFRDEAGRLHQQVATQADQVVFMIAGLPTMLKTEKGT